MNRKCNSQTAGFDVAKIFPPTITFTMNLKSNKYESEYDVLSTILDFVKNAFLKVHPVDILCSELIDKFQLTIFESTLFKDYENENNSINREFFPHEIAFLMQCVMYFMHGGNYFQNGKRDDIINKRNAVILKLAGNKNRDSYNTTLQKLYCNLSDCIEDNILNEINIEEEVFELVT